MKMGMRWFYQADDTIPLEYIRQVPGVTHVVGALFDVPVGDLAARQDHRPARPDHGRGAQPEVIESVNIHDDIKIGGPQRDWAIENYIATIKNLAQVGVKVICYNFMPVFDWTRTEMARQLPDGSFTLAFDAAAMAHRSATGNCRCWHKGRNYDKNLSQA